ncbi:MAG: DUF4198 domain-containing protein [Pseudomonadota bacterium]|nr:DUF4198 domain-containing protein [Pseudomonadota bacterium]
MRIPLLALALACFASSVQAHVPFLKPNQFNVLHPRLQVESAFTETPFQADFAMDSPHFALIAPDGSQQPLQAAAKTAAAVYLQPVLSVDGSYRITTGVRKGPLYRAVEAERNGKLYFADDIPRTPGKPAQMQYYSRADVYLAKGEPNYQMRASGEGIEILPLTSPNRLIVGGELRLQVLHQGKPVANARIVVGHDNEHYARHIKEDFYDVENTRPGHLHTDNAGMFTFRPEHGGLYFLFTTLHINTAPGQWDSHNAALTLEVMLPEHADGHGHHH